MKDLYIDIETYSSESIGTSGLYRYAESPDFKVLLVAYAFDNDPTDIIDLGEDGEELPRWLVEALQDPDVVKHAHNASFERVCLSHALGLKGTFLDPYQWSCSMIQAARCGLPLSLDQVGEALNLTDKKMKEGKNLIKLFCAPQKVKGGLFPQGERALPHDHQEEWEVFKSYCIRDVDVERAIIKATSWLRPTVFERNLYCIDQTINDRGVGLDLQMATNAVRIDAVYKARLQAEGMRISGLSNPSSVAQLRGWMSERLGYAITGLTKSDIPDLMESTNDPDIKRMLTIRSEMGKTSCAKYQTMLDTVCQDGRIHGLSQFHAARTGRWAGRLVQMQNLPQNHIDDLDFARNCVKEDDLDALELGYGNVPDALSQLIRTTFIPKPGYTYAVCDFSAIEARVIAWLAEEDWVLDVFRNGGDVYCATASKMFGVPVEKHGRNAHLRQKGKIAVLALGYGGGASALEAMGGARMGLTTREMQEIVYNWRKANPNIVKLWKDVERCAIACAVKGQTKQTNGLTFTMHDNGTMTIELPSGRLIAYPSIGAGRDANDRVRLKFLGTNQTTKTWGWVESYGGKMTENIIQAIARDCLAVIMARAEKAGYGIVFHVHDEIICEVPKENAEKHLQNIEDLFADPISWASYLPLKGAGYLTPYYKKD